MTELIKYDAACRALSEATRVDEVKAIRNKAVAVEAYARQAKDETLIFHATGIRMRAEIRAGELLVEMKERGERQKPGDDPQGRNSSSALPLAPKLSDLGVTKTQSSRWQQFATLPQKQQDEIISRGQKKAVNAVKGASKRTRQEMRAEDETRVAALVPIVGKFRTLVIDPPWDYEWLSVAGRASPGYATMTHEDLLTLDVPQWAEENCHMYLWVTNNFITRGCDLMKTWGFAHKTVLTWVKPRWGLGSYFRNSTEHVLFGVRGEMRTRSDSIGTHFLADLREHSEKPDIFYDIVRNASHGPYGELFQRTARPDFTNVFVTSLENAA